MTSNETPPPDFRAATTVVPNAPGGPARLTLQQAIQLAAGAYGSGRWLEAENLCRQILRVREDHFDALNLLGIIAAQSGRAEEALALFSRAAAANPNDPTVQNNLGNLFSGLKRPAEALQSYELALALKPDYAEALYNRGIVLAELQRPAEALASYERALELKPDSAEAHNNRGNALRDLKRWNDALASYERALALKPDYAEAHNNRGNALRDLHRPAESLASFARALELRPDYAEAYNNRGIALVDLNRRAEALANYERATALKPDYADAHANRGNVLRDLKRLAEAKASYERALALRPDYPFLPGMLLFLRLQTCDWTGLDAGVADLRARIDRGEKAARPFNALALTGSPSTQKQAAQTWVQEICPPGHALGPIAKRARGDRIRIGYYSADYYNHATTYLMAELFEAHDRARFELVAFSFGPPADDEMHRRVSAAFDRFIDVRGMSDVEVARLSRELEIDIAVDLKGYTTDARTGIFAERAAPLQVNYMGFPGTLGADYIDYIVADRTLVPDAERRWYTEKVVRLPHTYQVNDRKRRIAEAQHTRAELDLPATGFVFCCFNNNYKITPPTFDGWMRVLKQVEGSVLWLLEDNADAAGNLRRAAEARGVSADRLVFAQRMPMPDHLARQRAADLFLDTLPYCAHTTASDALWAGLPVLTRVGESFAGRVAASLLQAIGLPELITQTQAQFEERAVELAKDPQQLGQIRERLRANRETAPLFDTPRFARHMEAAYAEMVRRYQAGLPPDHIDVSA